MKGRKHSLKVRLRAFHIWQLLGYSPWKSEWTVADDTPEGNVRGFYRGAFDSIPFLNDDAKRTFVHLLLRPGYMIRDYIKGKHDIYLAPLTSLIIFYAFFSLVSSIAHPDFEANKSGSGLAADSVMLSETDKAIDLSISKYDSIGYPLFEEEVEHKVNNVINYANNIDLLLNLDKHPEAIDSPKKASLAAFESALRSQGINYFLGLFLILWPCLRIVLRKYSMGWAASATASAYILCQFSFFMLFVLILSLGQKNEIGITFMGLLIIIDYHQLLGIGFKCSLWLTIKTGIWLVLLVFLLILLLSLVLFIYFII